MAAVEPLRAAGADPQVVLRGLTTDRGMPTTAFAADTVGCTRTMNAEEDIHGDGVNIAARL